MNVGQRRPAPSDAASTGTGREDKKRQWITEWLAGLAKGRHTGQVQLIVHFNQGGVTRVVPMLEVAMLEQMERALLRDSRHLGG